MGKMKTRLVLVLAFITALEGKNYLIETGDLEISKEGLNYMSEAEAGEDVPCVDNSKHCPVWSKTGECEKNPDYMLVNCRKSCKVCTGVMIGRSPSLGQSPSNYNHFLHATFRALLD